MSLKRIWLSWTDFQRGLVIFVSCVALGCTFGIQQVYSLNAQGQAEIAERRDQTCTLFERTYNTKARSVINTHLYIDTLPAADVKSTFNQLIINLYPRTYRDALESRAPKYCNEKGVGLKEPPITLPKQRDYSHLIIKPLPNKGPKGDRGAKGATGATGKTGKPGKSG